MDRQPLMLGAIGLGVGAAMAATLPSTAIEADLLGQASADLQARARVVAGDVTERAADLADEVTAAITSEAQAQGLTTESLKQSTSDAVEKLRISSRSPRSDFAPSPDLDRAERNGTGASKLRAT